MGKPEWFLVGWDGSTHDVRYFTDHTLREMLTTAKKLGISISDVCIYPVSAGMTADEWLRGEE